MKTINLKQIILAFILFPAVLNAQQATKTTTDKARLSIEVDPMTFAFKGYSVHLRVQPKATSPLLLGIGTYAMDFPQPFVDMNPNNADQGWEVRLNQGYGVFGEYHFSEVNKKWFAGTQVSIQEYKIGKTDIQSESKFSNLLIMPYAGYTWQPFKFDFYIKPWAGLGYTTQIAGENKVDDSTYDISPVSPFMTVHLGYTL